MTHKIALSEQNILMKNFSKTDDIIKDMREIIETSRDTAYRAINAVLVQRNWLIGYRIAEEGFQGAERVEYGGTSLRSSLKPLPLNMERDLPKQTYIIFIRFTERILRFSRHRLENLQHCYHGHIMRFYYKSTTNRRATGMKKKRPPRRGA